MIQIMEAKLTGAKEMPVRNRPVVPGLSQNGGDAKVVSRVHRGLASVSSGPTLGRPVKTECKHYVLYYRLPAKTHPRENVCADMEVDFGVTSNALATLSDVFRGTLNGH